MSFVLTSHPARLAARSAVANVATISRRELRDAIVSRWLLLYTIGFAGLGLGVSYASGISAGGSGVAGFGRTSAGLINLVLLVVPLMGITAGAGSIDPRIGPLPQLKKPPLSSYNTYVLHDKKAQPVPTGTAVTYPLANGRTLQVTVVETTADKRFRVLTQITDASAHDYLKKLEVLAAPNEPFFVAGQNLDTKDPSKGALILGITIRP